MKQSSNPNFLTTHPLVQNLIVVSNEAQKLKVGCMGFTVAQQLEQQQYKEQQTRD